MKKESVVYFQEIVGHMRTIIERIIKDDYKILINTQDEFCYESSNHQTKIRYKLSVEESERFFTLVPNMRRCALVSVKRADDSEFEVVYFQTEKNEYCMEIDQEDEVDGEIEVFLQVRLDPNQLVFSNLKDVTLAKDEQQRLYVLATAFMDYVASKPAYRLRFVTGELFYNTKEVDQFLVKKNDKYKE